MTAPIRKAVLPVAGLGTRFLPATKAMPKEMLTVVDKPVIQYVVDEAWEAGIEHIVFVTGRNKSVIEDHFDFAFELEMTLEERGKTQALDELERNRPAVGTISYTRQQQPLGLGHAVYCAREIIGDEPFAVLLPDVVIRGERGCLGQLVDAYGKYGGNVLAVEEVAENELYKYGVVDVGPGEDGCFPLRGMVEKPAAGTAPSNMIITGRYILQPEIFDLLATQRRGAGNEIQLTDAMLALLESQDFTAVKFDGETFDCGSKIGFLMANLVFGLDHEDLAADLRPLLKDRLSEAG